MRMKKTIPLLLVPLLLVACDNSSSSSSASPGSENNFKHNHDLVYVEQVNPTCSEHGIKEHYKCTICDQLFKDTDATIQLDSAETIEKLPHAISAVESVLGDCSSPTIKEHYKCDVCNELFLDEKGEVPITIDQLKETTNIGHNLVFVPQRPATYNVDGVESYYKCSKCNTSFADEEGTQTIDITKRTIKSDGWLRFGLSTSNDGPGVQSTRAMINDTLFEKKEVLSSRVTYTREMNAGKTYNHQTHVNNAKDGVNARILQQQGETLEYKAIVKNNTEKPINLKIYLNDVDSGSALTVKLNGLEQKTLQGSYVCSGSTAGGWVKVEAVDKIASGSSFDFLGYMKTKDYWDYDKELNILQEATKKSFKVGDTFSSNGLAAYLTNDIYQDTVVNYVTNYDGHVFTNEDKGTQTVRVMFGSASATYEIMVS